MLDFSYSNSIDNVIYFAHSYLKETSIVLTYKDIGMPLEVQMKDLELVHIPIKELKSFTKSSYPS